MKTNEKKSVALLNFFGCRANRIKNSFKKPSKMLFGKIGLFLVLGVMILNVNFILLKNGENGVNISVGISNNANAGLYDFIADSARWTLYAATDPVGYFKSLGSTAVDAATTPVLWAFNWVLYGILALLSKLLVVSGALMDSALSQELFTSLMDQNIYRMWTIVRDILNMFFMILLLFSAFATIFQVEKYHIRKVIIMLIVMALLVNFSFPISRFIIDFSNSAMYFILDQITVGRHVSESALITNITSYGKLQSSSISGDSNTTTLILGLIVFTFVLFITMFAIAINLIIRLVAFMILIVLSPVGFVFAFFPDTKSVASSWWSALIKYALMGPIMTFFLYMAMVVFERNSLSTINLSDPGLGFIPTVINFIFIVTFLWMGLIASLKFGGDGSGIAMNMAKRTGSWVKGAAVGTAVGAVIVGANATGVPGGVRHRFNELKGGFARNREEKEAKIASTLGSSGAMSDLERKRYKESLDKMKPFSNQDLKTEAQKGNIAAAEELVNRKLLDQDTYEQVMGHASNAGDSKRKDDLTAKYKGANKEQRIDIVASIDAKKAASDESRIATTMTDHSLNRDQAREKILVDEINSKFTKLKHIEFAKQDFDKMYTEIDKKISSTNRMEQAEGQAMRDSIYQAFHGFNNEAKNEIAKIISDNQTKALVRNGVV